MPTSRGLSSGGGYDFADAPEVDARKARVMWDPDVCPAVLPLDVSDTERWLASVRSVVRVDVTTVVQRGTLHVLFQQGGRRLQLAVRVCRSASHPLTEAVLSPGALRQRLDALSRLNELLSRGRLLPEIGRVPTRSGRLTLLLRAVDAAAAGASHRDVACALFGVRRTDRDWADPRENLRDTVRRAIRAGRGLIAGRYRRLLR